MPFASQAGSWRRTLVPAGEARLEESLALRARGVVVVAHGGGSGPPSPPAASVARVLAEAGFVALRCDLLARDEEADWRKTFDIDLLAERLLRAVTWVRQQREASDLSIGLFGAGTGAAAALQAAARAPEGITAVVSLDGRPDLAAAFLPGVQARTLLIVDGSKAPLVALNETALELLPGPKELAIVPDTAFSDEPARMAEVARLARDWFQRGLEEAPKEPPSISASPARPSR